MTTTEKDRSLIEELTAVATVSSSYVAFPEGSPPRLSLELQEGVSLSLPYIHITSFRCDGQQEVRICCGEQQIILTGYNLAALYQLLNSQRVSRIIEQGDEQWEGPEHKEVLVVSIDHSKWEGGLS